MKKLLLLLLLTQCQFVTDYHAIINARTNSSLFSGQALDPLDRFIYVDFDPNIYHSTGGGVQSSDLAVVFTQNGGTATACSISSITQVNGSALIGGENIIKVNLTFTGSVHGEETLEIKPSSDSTMRDSNYNYVLHTNTAGLTSLYPTYHPYYQNVVAWAITSNITLPNIDQRAQDNIMVTAAATYWSTFDGIYPTANNKNDRRFGMINWAHPGTNDITVSGTPDWGDNAGVKSASGSFLNTHLTPSTTTNFTHNNCAVWIYLNNSAAQNTYVVGSAGGTGANIGRVGLRPFITGNKALSVIDRNSAGTTFTNTYGGKGLFYLTRSSSTDEKTYVDNNLLYSQAPLSSVMSNKEIYLTASNENGTAGFFNTVAYVGFAAFSSNNQSNASTLTTIFNTWISATTQPSPPADHGRFYAWGGQSNTSGHEDASTFPDSLKAPIQNSYFFSTLTHTWVPLQAGASGCPGNTSPMFSFAYDEHVKHPSDKLYFVMYAVGGSPLSSWQQGGINATQLVSYINNAKSILTIDNYEPFYFFQGEQDAKTYAMASVYQTQEQTMMAYYMGVVGTDRAMSFEINPNLPSGVFPYTSTVNSGKYNNKLNGFYGAYGVYLPTGDLDWGPDNIHLSTLGDIQAGKRASLNTTP